MKVLQFLMLLGLAASSVYGIATDEDDVAPAEDDLELTRVRCARLYLQMR